MNITKVLLAGLFAVSVCIALEVNISGKVTDASGISPLAGAVVKLEKAGLTATTGSDGAFSLTGVSIHSTINQLQDNKISVSTGNGVLYLHLQERGPVEVVTYTLQGKAVSKVQKVMDIGTHSIAQPNIGNGVYLYRLKSGKSEQVIKNLSLGRVSGGVVSGETGISTTATARRMDRYVPINDVIAVTKDGYLNYRVIVTNSDTSGIEIKMIACAGTVTDLDGNVYQTVIIGNQVWTVEGLRTTKYNDGSAIRHITDSATWINDTLGAYCYYNNTTNADSIKKFGALYNWYAVDTKKLAPAGWHVPDSANWGILENYLIANGFNWDGTTEENKIAKSLAAQADWLTYEREGCVGYDLTSNNKSGFSALPGGSRRYDGNFLGQGSFCLWWSATENDASSAYTRYINYNNVFLDFRNLNKEFGFSVRLVRDISQLDDKTI